MGEAERAYLRMAARQYGVLSRAQALACGLSEDEIQGRLERGAWVRRLPSVYRLMGSPPGWMQELMAAVLWAGPGAAVSHRAAAALWKMDGFSPEGVELSAPHQLRAEPGIIVHRTGRLDRKDVVWIARLPATGAARTLLDLGAVVDPERVEEALECCLRRGWVTAARLRGR
ncbi:MAG TPA: hypothetical protein VEY30_05520, partial [Myxococcaceae bacterium]|nr:hypothetical protein [Myxococcaceae bacterium]